MGVIIDNELNWKEHIDYTYKKLIKYTSIFHKLRNKLPYHCLKGIYFAFVHPHLLYGVEIYASTNKSYLHALEILNNKILRILQNRPLRTHIKELYNEFNTLPLRQLHSQQILTLVHCFFHHINVLPTVYFEYFTRNCAIHCHNTRQKCDLHLDFTKKAQGHRSVHYQGCVLWNKLPQFLKQPMSKQAFKRKLKLLLLAELWLDLFIVCFKFLSIWPGNCHYYFLSAVPIALHHLPVFVNFRVCFVDLLIILCYFLSIMGGQLR